MGASFQRSVALVRGESTYVYKAITYRARDGVIENCSFCDFAAKHALQDRAEKLVSETDSVVGFIPKRKDADVHYLVAPKKHISTISTLTTECEDSARLLQEIEVMAANLLELGAKEHGPHVVFHSRLVFHKPPFNSVDHLHLHVLGGNFATAWKNFTFTPGFPWCSSLAQVQRGLKAGSTVGVTRKN